MIKGYCQDNYKRAVLNVLEAWGGQAYARDVIDALMNGPDEFRLDLTSEEKVQTGPCGNNTFKHAYCAAVEQLRKEGYIKPYKPYKDKIWRRTQKPYTYRLLINLTRNFATYPPDPLPLLREGGVE